MNFNYTAFISLFLLFVATTSHVGLGYEPAESAAKPATKIIFVTPLGIDTNSGLMQWENGVQTLTKGLALAAETRKTSPDAKVEIWVAVGTYKSKSVKSDRAFQLVPEVPLKGGYKQGLPGSSEELSNSEMTIISGRSELVDEWIQGTQQTVIDMDPDVVAKYHVQNAVITGGRADAKEENKADRDDPECRGGGVFVPPNATLTLANVWITGNYADEYGGGIYNLGSTKLVNCTIEGNSSRGYGGGVVSFSKPGGTPGKLIAINSVIFNNKADGEKEDHKASHLIARKDSVYPEEAADEKKWLDPIVTATANNQNVFALADNIEIFENCLIAGDVECAVLKKRNSGCLIKPEVEFDSTDSNALIEFLTPTQLPSAENPGVLGNARLKRISPAIDRGKDLPEAEFASLDFDLAGNQRKKPIDIGAFEYPKESNQFYIEFVDHGNRKLADRIKKVNEANSDEKLENDVAEIWLDSGFHKIEKTVELPAHVTIRGGFNSDDRDKWLDPKGGFYKLKVGFAKAIENRKGDQTNPDDPTSPPESVLKGNDSQTVLLVDRKRGVKLDRLFVMGGYAKKTDQPALPEGETAKPLPAGDGSGGGLRITRGLGGFDCDVEIENCVFTKNIADNFGGAIWTNGNLKLQHCTVAGNEAKEDKGGGLAIVQFKGSEPPEVISEHSLFACNLVKLTEPILPETKPAAYQVTNSDLYGKISNLSKFSFALSQGHLYRDEEKSGDTIISTEELDRRQKFFVGLPPNHLLASKPKSLFIDLSEDDKKPDLRPTRVSPLIDQPNDAVGSGMDLFGAPRLSRFTESTGGLDFGAYEYQFSENVKVRKFETGDFNEIVKEVFESNLKKKSEHVSEIQLDAKELLVKERVSVPPFLKIVGIKDKPTTIKTDGNSLQSNQELKYSGLVANSTLGVEFENISFEGSRAQIIPNSRTDGLGDWKVVTVEPAETWRANTFDDSTWLDQKASFGSQDTSAVSEWSSSELWMRKQFKVESDRQSIFVTCKHDLIKASVFLNGAEVHSFEGSSGETYKLQRCVVELKAGVEHVLAIHATSKGSGSQFLDPGLVSSSHSGLDVESKSLWSTSVKIEKCRFSRFNRALNVSSDPRLVSETGYRTRVGIDSSIFFSNELDSAGAQNGAAIEIVDSELTISKSLFRENIAESNGGAISAAKTKIEVTESTFHSNSTFGINGKSNIGNVGGAVHLRDNVTGKISFCTFAYNQASEAGAVWFQSPGVNFENNLCTQSHKSDGVVAASEIGFGEGFVGDFTLKKKLPAVGSPTEVYELPDKFLSNYLGELPDKSGKNVAIYYKLPIDGDDPIKAIQPALKTGFVSPFLSDQELIPVVPLWQMKSPLIDKSEVVQGKDGDFNGVAQRDIGAAERSPVIPYVIFTVFESDKETPVRGQKLELAGQHTISNSKGQAIFRNTNSVEIVLPNGFSIGEKNKATDFGWGIHLIKD